MPPDGLDQLSGGFTREDQNPALQPSRRAIPPRRQENLVLPFFHAKDGSRLETEPVRFRVVMTLTVKADAVPAGETVRAWLPFPREYPAQTEIRSAASPPEAPMRAAYLEKKAEAGRPVVFELEYAFTRQAVRFDLDPAKARDASNEFLDERPPHVVFTPELRALAREIAGGETNPLRKARRIYEWCAANVVYAFAHEYSTIQNISEACLRERKGDCGQIGLLFITLCRLSGVPARWQSGWVIEPGRENLHDWTEICVEPWGWVPVDPWAAQALNHSDGLSEARKEEIRNHYFGGLDPYRMVANRDHGMPLSPPKVHPRSDDVDSQRGEVELEGGNLYYDAFDYKLEASEIPIE